MAKHLDTTSVKDRSKPTWDNQLWHARRLYHEQGAQAVWNPHGMIGKDCGCNSCFCCAAYQTYKAHLRSLEPGGPAVPSAF